MNTKSIPMILVDDQMKTQRNLGYMEINPCKRKGDNSIMDYINEVLTSTIKMKDGLTLNGFCRVLGKDYDLMPDHHQLYLRGKFKKFHKLDFLEFYNSELDGDNKARFEIAIDKVSKGGKI